MRSTSNSEHKWKYNDVALRELAHTPRFKNKPLSLAVFTGRDHADVLRALGIQYDSDDRNLDEDDRAKTYFFYKAKSGRIRVYTDLNTKSYHLGTFDTREEAQDAVSEHRAHRRFI